MNEVLRQRLLRSFKPVFLIGLCALTCGSSSRESKETVVRAARTQLLEVKPDVRISPGNGALSAVGSAERAPFDALPLVRVFNVNTKEQQSLRLYDGHGQINEVSAKALERLFADSRRRGQLRAAPIERRLLQILFRATYHFGQRDLEIISGYREPLRRREGLHAKGKAVDFRIPGILATVLAAYLRQIPRLGVGVYTHSKTQFVHVDVREDSYHWLDASPPRRHWRERSLNLSGLSALDRSYRRDHDDWPEGYPVRID